MKINRSGSAQWQGGLKDGKGAISTESGALNAHPYGFATRFEGVPGTNPEELIGAAHAGCFTMALSLILGEAKLTAERMDTTAKVTLEQVEGGFAITAVHLALKAKIPGADQRRSKARRHGEGWMSGVQTVEDRDYSGRCTGLVARRSANSARRIRGTSISIETPEQRRDFPRILRSRTACPGRRSSSFRKSSE